MVDMRGTGDDPTAPSEAMGIVVHSYQPNEKVPESEAEMKNRYLQILEGKRTPGLAGSP